MKTKTHTADDGRKVGSLTYATIDKQSVRVQLMRRRNYAVADSKTGKPVRTRTGWLVRPTGTHSLVFVLCSDLV